MIFIVGEINFDFILVQTCPLASIPKAKLTEKKDR